MSLLPKGGMSRGGSGGLLSRLQNRRGGLLGTNPLTYMGLGLLSQGPSLTPQSPWQGLGVGLGMYGAMQDRLATQDFQQAKMDLEREKFADARAQREAEAGQAEQQRAAQIQRLIAGGMAPDQAANVVAAGSFDKFSGPEKPEALKVVVGEDGKPRYVPASEAIGMEAARTPPISLTMGAAPEPLGEDASKWQLDGKPVPPGWTRDQAIAAGATPKTAGEEAADTTSGRAAGEASAALEAGQGVFQNYMNEAAAYRDQPWPMGAARGNASAARDALVTWVATNVLGQPGTEPSPKLYAQAEEMVPDFAGPYDSKVFDQRMSGLMRTIEGKLAAQTSPLPDDSGPARVELPDSETLSPDELVEKYRTR